jgi:hypothetical protein
MKMEPLKFEYERAVWIRHSGQYNNIIIKLEKECGK